MKDQATEIKAVNFTSGNQVDVQGAESLTLVGPVVSGTTYTIEEGDASNGSDKVAVDAKNIIVADSDGSKALNVVTYSGAGTAQIGYVGKKQYVTITIGTPATSPKYYGIKGNLRYSPEV